MIYKVTPRAGCRNCNGTGEVVDYVDYGSASVPMYSTCDCVDSQLPEEFDYIKDTVEFEEYTDD